MPPEASSNAGLTISGNVSPTSCAALEVLDHHAARDRQAVRGEQRLGLRLLLAQRQRERPVAGVRDPEQLEQRRDVVLVLRVVAEELDEVHHDVRACAARIASSIVSKLSRMLTITTSWPRSASDRSDQLHLLLDGLPRLDLHRGIPLGGATTIATVMLRTHRRRSGSRGSGCANAASDDGHPQVPLCGSDVDDRQGADTPAASPTAGAGSARRRGAAAPATAGSRRRARTTRRARARSRTGRRGPSRGRSRGRDRCRRGPARGSRAGSESR